MAAFKQFNSQDIIISPLQLTKGFEFKGGGTWFPKYNYLANPTEIGMCTLHPGNITHKHGARPVTEGTRYVVVSFIKSKDHK